MAKIKSLKDLEQKKKELSALKTENTEVSEVPGLKVEVDNSPRARKGDYYTGSPSSNSSLMEQQSNKRQKTVLDGSAGVDKRGIGTNAQDVINEYESIETRPILPSLVKLGAKGFLNEIPGVNLSTQKEVEDFGNALIDKAKKEQLVNEYNVAKNKQIADALQNYDPLGSNTMSQLWGGNYSKLTSPVQYRNALAEITPYLAERGVTPAQLEDYIKTQTYKEQNKRVEENVLDNKLGYNLGAFATNVIGGAGTTANAIESLFTGRPLAEKQSVNEYAKLTPIIRNTTGEDIEWNANTELGGKIAKGAYDVATSLGDMGMSLALAGGSQPLSLALMSTNAGANTLQGQMDKDTTDAQKLATAFSSGAIEALTEAIPLDSLFKIANNAGTKQTLKVVLGNILKQGGQEFTEEAISEVANTFVDNVINGEQSDYGQMVNSYMAQGMDAEQAANQAKWDVAGNALYSALVGFFSGAASGTGASVVGNINYNNSRFANEIENPQAMQEYLARQQANNEQLRGLAINSGEVVEPTLNSWIMQQEPTFADRIRQLIDPMPSWSNQNTQTRNMINEVPGIGAETQATPQTQVNAQPLENYNATKIEGFPEVSKNVWKQVNWYGKGNQEVANLYADFNRNVNKYVQTYDQTAINNAVNDLIAIDAQLQGKTNTYNGKTYAYMDNSILEDFVNNSTPLQKMARHNALGEALPQDMANTNTNANATTDFKNVDKTVGMYGDKYTKNKYGQYKQYLDRYMQEQNPTLLEQANKLGAEIEAELKGKTYKRKDGKVFNYKENNFTNQTNKIVQGLSTQNTEQAAPAVNVKLEGLEPAKPKAKSNRTMSESIGLGNNNASADISNPNISIRQNANGSEILSYDMYADEPNSTQTSRNSMINYFEDMPDVQNLIEAQRKEGKFDKEVHTNEETLKKAQDAINEDREAVIRDLYKKEFVDEVDAAKSLMLARQLHNEGNAEEAQRILQNLSYKASTPGRVLQILGAMAGTGEGAIIKANALIQEETNAYFKRPGNKSKKERCGKLATALKNIGNDHTNDPAPRQPKTYSQIRQGVVNELAKESSSVFDIFNDNDIDYLARMVERGVTTDEIQYKLEERLATGTWDISNEDLEFVLDKFKEANKYDINSKASAELQMEAYKRLAEYLPDASMMEKWNNWRYLAMLGNPRTHIRNLVGNFLFGNIVTNISDNLAGLMEAGANGIVKGLGGEGFERTKTAAIKDLNLIRGAEQYALDHAWAQLTDVKNKYSDMKRDIASERSIYKNKVLEGYRKASGGLLTKSDEMSLMAKYKKAMAGYLQANGKDASIFNSTNPEDIALLERASADAVRRAKEATFHEDNKLADKLTQISTLTKNGGVAGNILYGLEEAIIPFKKTPANILKQSFEYSPVGLLNVLYDAANKNPAMLIENLSKSMTGTGIMLVGYMLASKGLLRAKGDERNADLDKLTGEQDFSLNIGDHSFTLDWAAPAALPLFIGARLYENYYSDDDLGVLDALASAGDPLVEMSMLQGISDAVKTVSTYDKEKNGFAELLMNLGYNYVGQAVPTVAGQIARSVDDTRRTTYTGKTGVADTIGKLINKTENKIPGLSMTNEPYIDAWGQTQENAGGNVAGRLLNNMIFPWYYSNTAKSELEEELYRLNDATGNTVAPKIAETSYEKEKLNPQEYTEYAQIKGQNAERILTDVINNPRYDELDDNAKSELLADMLKFSNALSKSDAFDYAIADSNSYKKEYQAYQYGGVDGIIDYLTLKDVTGGKTSDAERIQGLESMDGLSDEDKIFYFKQGKKEYSKQAQYLDKINEKYAYDWYKIQSENGRSKDKMIYGIYTSDLPEDEKQTLLNVLGMNDDTLTYYLLTTE